MFDNLTPEQIYWIFGIVGTALCLTLISMFAAYKRFNREPISMMIWVQVSIIPFFGPLAYLLIGRKNGEKKQ